MVGLLSLQESTLSAIAEKTSTAYLLGLKDDGDPDPKVSFAFQFFPDSVQDTKAVNWAPREIPGASLPIYQWTSSGERIVAFTAYFAADMDLGNPEGGGSTLYDRLKTQGVAKRSPDIRAAIVALRQFMLPTYGAATQAGTPIAKAPQKILLGLPGTGIGASGGLPGESSGQEDEIPCIMTQCDVTYEALFPSGLPRVVLVSLSFGQTAQAGKAGATIFPHRSEQMRRLAVGGPGTPYFPWPMEIVSANRARP